MNRYIFLFAMLTGMISMPGWVWAEQPSDQSDNSSLLFIPDTDQVYSGITTVSAGMNGTDQLQKEGNGVPEKNETPPGLQDTKSLTIHTTTTPNMVDNEPIAEKTAIPPGWMTYLADPRYTIQIPPQWSVFQTTTTSDNGTIIMFQDNSSPPSFVSVMAADNQNSRFFTKEEAEELEMKYVTPSFQRWGLQLITDAGGYRQSDQASLSHSVLAGDSDQQVVSSFILSDSSGYYWISLIGPDHATYMRNVAIFNQILSSFIPASSVDARLLWDSE